jgi:hypothetical protein
VSLPAPHRNSSRDFEANVRSNPHATPRALEYIHAQFTDVV